MTADPTPPERRPGDLGSLGERLERGRSSAGLTPPGAAPDRPDTAVGDGLRVAIEFVVSTLVGAGLGWFIGGLLGGAVIGLLAGLILGFAAGLRGVYRGMMAGQGAGGTGTEADDDA